MSFNPFANVLFREISLIDSVSTRFRIGYHFADLVARPIGRRILEPETNRAYEILSKKLFRAGERGEGLGLKVFP